MCQLSASDWDLLNLEKQKGNKTGNKGTIHGGPNVIVFRLVFQH